ncbi:MAG: prepilin-type N-terminal cleavage/methylation domain-containing protein, partial [Cyanobium sp.]
HRHARTHGFTLLELLIVLMLGGLMMTAITTVITSQLRLGRTQLRAQQLGSDWSRFTTFLANEVGEGELVTTSPTTPPSSGCRVPGGGRPLFSLTVAIAEDTGDPVWREVYYYTTGTGENTVLWRCGPAIEPDGRLNNTIRDFIPAQLLSGIPLSAAIDANQVSVTICNYTSPACTLNAAGASGANIGPFSVHTLTIQIF